MVEQLARALKRHCREERVVIAGTNLVVTATLMLTVWWQGGGDPTVLGFGGVVAAIQLRLLAALWWGWDEQARAIARDLAAQPPSQPAPEPDPDQEVERLYQRLLAHQRRQPAAPARPERPHPSEPESAGPSFWDRVRDALGV